MLGFDHNETSTTEDATLQPSLSSVLKVWFQKTAKLLSFFWLFLFLSVCFVSTERCKIVRKRKLRQIKAFPFRKSFILLILHSDIPSRGQAAVFAAVWVIRCGCGGQLPTPRLQRAPNFMWVAERMCLRLFALFMLEKTSKATLRPTTTTIQHFTYHQWQIAHPGKRSASGSFFIYLLSVWRWNATRLALRQN